MKEMNFCISERAENFNNINYLFKTCQAQIFALGGEVVTKVGDGRAYFLAKIPDGCEEIITAIILDKVSDVIAINYKYNYFKKQIRTLGLNEFEYELLLASLISADLKEDKRYVLKRQKNIDNLPIDALFNFQLGALKDKWAEVVGYIPTYFSTEKLCEFINYIVNEKPNKCIRVVNGRVYDANNTLQLKGELMGYVEHGAITRELILSDTCRVFLDTKLTDIDQKYLARFFGDKIFFKKGLMPIKKS